ncbi:trans-1,2-dihydrobenzene-1,2-diol dehydrogenase-like isoform X1 [Pectinophora gossypiella]|uniref:trans-1,2-dihydrobenzene-1,2-diol dehydrogenase-like isoform X1 n=2 Tax=Pectinophora gossypiella TaxID=13191 RepID=UPI00214EB2E9|nr:trans-1,2-dihydrobenzene-1,2-diol dehydrogenase-like isoform X1 [Pectinophora gossypiella]XP_049883015.1 trans-1,2-dihydrobenzene-1,2-diol dehydrogenase-like isoform X1 [Pectinophora gossypiella]
MPEEESMGIQLKWGIAGVGMIAHDFLTALETLPAEQHKVVAIAGKDLERVHRLATLHKINTAYEGYQALACDDSIDIVFVSVLNLQHYEITKLMLDNGKHVLCEKPMGMTYKQTKSLVDLAREKKLFLLEGMWSRFFPAYDALDQHIASGGLGDIYHISIQFGVEINEIERNLMKDLGGGAVLDLGVYMLQLVQFIYKEPPTDIVCTGHLSKAGVDESISCALKYKDGRTATLSAHTRANMTNRAEIIGTKGSIGLDYFWCPTVLHISAANNTEWTLPKGKYKFHFHNSAGLSYEIQECWDCINAGVQESPKMNLDESVLLSKLTDTMRAQLGVLENGL